ncbi:MAG TPA: class I SAM-dependent methyltransferase [Gaiellales bacterium]|jgi:SAM-dependent methyltransferase|nr:class I SAM-dependent methyltransferase [Gaiellales bacterium]
MSTAEPDWFDRFSDEEHPRLAIHRSPAEATAAEVDFLALALGLTDGARVLDLACGHGRHSVELARRGCVVTWVDLSEPSLELAATRAAEAGVDVRLELADMRRIGFEGEFDAVINMFTAFGYFADEADDRLVLERVAAALVPRGACLLETINPVGVFPRFEARMARARGRDDPARGARLRHGAGPVRDVLDGHQRWRAPRAPLLAPRIHGARAHRHGRRGEPRGGAAVGRPRRLRPREGLAPHRHAGATPEVNLSAGHAD